MMLGTIMTLDKVLFWNDAGYNNDLDKALFWNDAGYNHDLDKELFWNDAGYNYEFRQENVVIANPSEPPPPGMCDKALGMSDDSIDGTVSYSSFTINSGKGGLENPWLPESDKFIGSFIQVDFQRVGFFTKIEIKGGMINERTGYVKEVRVEILKEKNNKDSWKEIGTFKANTDVTTTDILSFNMTMGYAIRLQPIIWEDYPIIGFEVFGCLPGQPATTPTQSPSFTSGNPSTASTPTTGTQAGAPGTSPPLIQTTQPSVTTGAASTTAASQIPRKRIRADSSYISITRYNTVYKRNCLYSVTLHLSSSANDRGCLVNSDGDLPEQDNSLLESSSSCIYIMKSAHS
ncbi:unnamed protein product [Mytilus coruscus]|uniref:F5/8 type C domain-containing protein n=1 Tax=Mytilus coruscus TaxID=42192 RepID=A0A6J8DAL3_MYTCO|nr:unnamed protein product [Mytilus coruscus]